MGLMKKLELRIPRAFKKSEIPEYTFNHIGIPIMLQAIWVNIGACRTGIGSKGLS